MAYEKYIKKDGKIYGPYIYHSRRVDGKVISEYHGQAKRDYKKFFVFGLGILFLIVVIYFLGFSQKGMTGHAVLDLNANYQEGEPLTGSLRMSLQSGELLPVSSEIIFENNRNVFTYNLREIVSETPVQGEFYITGLSISGAGEGYGIAGEREIFPEVDFVLSILSEQSSGETTEQIPLPEEPEANLSEEITEPIPEEIIPEPVPETEPATEPESEETASEEQAQEPAPETAPEESAPITGGVISGFFSGFGMTGNVIAEVETEVQGKVSSGQTFTYELQEGQRAELKLRSVKVNGEQLPDDAVNINVEGNDVIVTTDYSETEQGFGREYLGEGFKELNIELSDLGLILEPGDLKIRIVDSNEEIISLTTILGKGQVSGATEEIQAEIPSENQTQIPSEEVVNVTSNESLIIPTISSELTSEERKILEAEFGNLSIQITEAKSKNGFIIIRYELGGYWVENSYSDELDNATLRDYMEKDKIRWLKDIAKKLSETEEPEQDIEVFLGNESV